MKTDKQIIREAYKHHFKYDSLPYVIIELCKHRERERVEELKEENEKRKELLKACFCKIDMEIYCDECEDCKVINEIYNMDFEK